MTIQEYFGDWSKVIDLQEANRLIQQLVSIPSSVKMPGVCPLPQDTFKAFRLCPYNNLRVVIIGQDPYPNLRRAIPRDSSQGSVPVATGLAFANTSDTPEKSLSPSLEILRESVIDFSVPHRCVTFDPSLEKWEKQGVLMLNTALSCLTGKVGSHTLMWRPFIKSLLTKLSEYHSGIVYVLMGTAAQSFELYINKQFNHIIKTRHPSWYAREHQKMPSDLWQSINKILISQNGYGIQWYEEN